MGGVPGFLVVMGLRSLGSSLGVKLTEDLPHHRLRVRSLCLPCLVKRREFAVVRRLLVRRLVVGGPGGRLNSALCCALHQQAVACVSLPTEGKRLATQEKELEEKTKKKKRKQQEEKTQETNVESDAHERNEKHQEEENTKHEEE